MAEDRGQLAGHPIDLVVGQLEAREARDVEDLGAVDHAAADDRRGLRADGVGRRRGRAAAVELAAGPVAALVVDRQRAPTR